MGAPYKEIIIDERARYFRCHWFAVINYVCSCAVRFFYFHIRSDTLINFAAEPERTEACPTGYVDRKKKYIA